MAEENAGFLELIEKVNQGNTHLHKVEEHTRNSRRHLLEMKKKDEKILLVKKDLFLQLKPALKVWAEAAQLKRKVEAEECSAACFAVEQEVH